MPVPLRNRIRTRILAADDSAVMRGVLHLLFPPGDGPLELVGVVRDGLEALSALDALSGSDALRPDLLLLDLEMPRLDGLGVLKALARRPASPPVLVLSAHSERSAQRTLEALALGARDYVMKPARGTDLTGTLEQLRRQLLPRIDSIAPAPVCSPAAFLTGEAASAASSMSPAAAPQVVVVGVSTGGPVALEALLPALPAHFPVPILLVQHMPRLFTAAFADRLDRICPLAVRLACEGALLLPGTVWLAPGDQHLLLSRRGDRLCLELNQAPPRHSCRPAVDTLFESAAAHFGPHTLAVILTGMGQDGLAGAAAVRDQGGMVLAQDEASSAVWGMPGRVVEAGLASAVVPLDELAHSLCRYTGMAPQPAANYPLSPFSIATESSHGLL